MALRCVREEPALLGSSPSGRQTLGSRGAGLEGALGEIMFNQNPWVLGRTEVLVLEEDRKGEEDEEKLFST